MKYVYTIVALLLPASAFAQSTGTAVNPLPGSVWQYLGPTLGADWSQSPFPNLSGVPAITATLTGNPSGATLGGLNVSIADTSGLGKRQVGLIVGIANNAVSTTLCPGGTTNGNCDMIGTYSGAALSGGMKDGFAANLLIDVALGWNAANIAGLAASGGAWVAEFDSNNHDANFGETLGPNGMFPPFVFGLDLVANYNGSTLFRQNAAVVVAGYPGATGPGWNRGFVCGNYATNGDVKQACFADYSSSDIGLDLRGTHAVAGLDGRNGTFNTYFIAGPPTPTYAIPTFWDALGNIQAGELLVRNGNGALPSPQADGTQHWGAVVYNGINAIKQQGLLVTSNWAVNTSNVLEVGHTDFTTGAYTSYLAVKGDGTMYAFGTLGSTCSGTPTASFASTNGFVTHC